MSELLHDTSFGLAMKAIVKTTMSGIQAHPVDSEFYWVKQPPRVHIAHALIHLDKFLDGMKDEEHHLHALTRLVMTVELLERERIAQEAKANAYFNFEAIITAEIDQFTSAMTQAGQVVQDASARIQSSLSQATSASNAHLSELEAKTEESSRSIREKLDSMAETAKRLAETFLIFEGVHLFREMTSETLETNERLRNMSTSTGISIAHLQELQFAAAATGVDFNRLTQFTAQLTRQFVAMQSSTGGGRQGAVLAAAGLKPSDLEDSYTALVKISDAMQRLGTNSMQTRALLTTFGGRGGLELAPLLAQFQELSEKARDMGLVLSDSVLNELDKSREAFNVLGFVIDVDKARIAAALTPALQTMAALLTQVAEKVNVLSQTGGLDQWALAAFGNAMITLAEDIVKLAAAMDKLISFAEKLHSLATGMFLGAITGAEQLNKTVGGANSTLEEMRAAMNKQFGGIGPLDIVGPEQKTPPVPPDTFASASQIKAQKDKELQDFAEQQAIEVQLANNTAAAKVTAEENVYNKAVALFGARSIEAEKAYVAELGAQRSANEQILAQYEKTQQMEVALAGSTGAAKIQAAQNTYNETVRLFGQQSDLARDNAMKEVEARQEYVNQLRAQDATEISNIASNNIAVLNVQKEGLAQELALHQITKAQELAGEQQFANQEQAITDNMYDQLLALYANDVKEFQRTLQEKIKADLSFEQKRVQNGTQSITEQVADQQRLASAMESTMSQIEGIFQKGTKTQAALMKMGVDDMLKIINGFVSQAITELLTITPVINGLFSGNLAGGGFGGIGAGIARAGLGLVGIGGAGAAAGGAGAAAGAAANPAMQTIAASTAHMATTLVQHSTMFTQMLEYGAQGVAHAAAQLAQLVLIGATSIETLAVQVEQLTQQLIQSALASAHSIPIIGPYLAQGGIIPSAAGGMIADGRGTPIPALLHPRELVLPQPIADRVTRAFPEGGEPGAGGKGETHVHNHNWQVNTMDGADFESVLKRNSGAIDRFVRKMVR